MHNIYIYILIFHRPYIFYINLLRDTPTIQYSSDNIQLPCSVITTADSSQRSVDCIVSSAVTIIL